jgi:hypothetical protein
MTPHRYLSPPGEIRFKLGNSWVWACSDREWPRAFQSLYWFVEGEDVTFANGYPHGWFALRTRGIKPPWPTFIDQQDPGDEIEQDGFITYSGPSEGFTQQGAQS